MRRALSVLILVLGFLPCASCVKVETDIKWARWKEDMADVVRGRDRGYLGYREMIEKATVKGPSSPRYQYIAPEWVSNYLVTRAVRGLGGTKWPNSDYAAGSVDRLLYVLNYDPTGVVRAAACSQLGRIARRLGVPAADPYPYLGESDEKIREIADDLFDLQKRLDKKERIKASLVIERIDELETLYPTRFLMALQLMRACASPPVVLAPPGPLRETVERALPKICRRSISISLAEAACGSIHHTKARPDESDDVRSRALEVLTALNDPVAREPAVARLWDELDPAERDAGVRMRLLEYIGNHGSARAFEAAVRRLDNDLPSVRFAAQAALLHMTATRVEAKPQAWRKWREQHPDWQQTLGAPAAASGG